MSKRTNVEFTPPPPNGQPYHTLVLPAILKGKQDPITALWGPDRQATQLLIDQVKEQTYLGSEDNLYFADYHINVDWKRKKIYIAQKHACPEDSIYSNVIFIG